VAIFVFSSKDLTNIWAGIGAGLWAVSRSPDAATHQGRVTKAKNMRVGSFGILYCSATQSLTTPFIVFSSPDPKAVINNIWKGEWVLPFKIHPLGTPTKSLSKNEAMKVLPTLRTSGKNNIGHVINVQAITAFSPSRLIDQDWEVLIGRLADGAANA
jgi:hypothetical protein